MLSDFSLTIDWAEGGGERARSLVPVRWQQVKHETDQRHRLGRDRGENYAIPSTSWPYRYPCYSGFQILDYNMVFKFQGLNPRTLGPVDWPLKHPQTGEGSGWRAQFVGLGLERLMMTIKHVWIDKCSHLCNLMIFPLKQFFLKQKNVELLFLWNIYNKV